MIARDLSEMQVTLDQLRVILITAWVATVAACAALLSWVVSHSLTPLGALRKQIEGLEAQSLDRRFHVDHVPAELEPVVSQLNGFVKRLEKAFQRERAFTADVAHELRTPLAGLQATIEVALTRKRSDAEYRQALEQCLAINEQLLATVESMLELARSAGTLHPEERERVQLAELLRTLWSSFEAQAARRGLSLELSATPSVEFETHAELVKRLFVNLYENAVEYADEGSEIGVLVEQDAVATSVTFTNRCAAAPADLAEHAFEPFWRADGARSAVGRHAGLGLSICERISELLDAAIGARYEDGEFIVRVDFK